MLQILQWWILLSMDWPSHTTRLRQEAEWCMPQFPQCHFMQTFYNMHRSSFGLLWTKSFRLQEKPQALLSMDLAGYRLARICARHAIPLSNYIVATPLQRRDTFLGDGIQSFYPVEFMISDAFSQ